MADYDINENTTIDFAVGCGTKTITLGDNDFSTILNFLSDTRNGYISQYKIQEALSSDVTVAGTYVIPQGGIMITRITGVPTDTSQDLPYNDITSDHIIITDYLTNGQDKVSFVGTIVNNNEATNCLLEDAIGNDPKTTLLFDTINTTSGEVFNGSWLSEIINGTSSANTIHGGAGNDTIDGKSGNDVIFGDSGKNNISDGDGNDTIYGGTSIGDEITYNTDGSIATGILWNIDGDTISLGKGNDVVYAGAGNDSIIATSFNKTDNNVIYAGAGNDYIAVSGMKGSVVNTVYGGTGADTYKVSGKYSSQIFMDANSEDTLQHTNISGAEYSYSRDGQDLIITQTSGTDIQTITLKDHFTKLATGTQLDKFYITDSNGNIQQDLSLLENAVFNVTLADGETYNSTPGYKDNITVVKNATITGDYAGDSVFFKDLNGNPIPYTLSRNGADVTLTTNVQYIAKINITPNGADGEEFAYISDN